MSRRNGRNEQGWTSKDHRRACAGDLVMGVGAAVGGLLLGGPVGFAAGMTYATGMSVAAGRHDSIADEMEKEEKEDNGENTKSGNNCSPKPYSCESVTNHAAAASMVAGAAGAAALTAATGGADLAVATMVGVGASAIGAAGGSVANSVISKCEMDDVRDTALHAQGALIGFKGEEW